MPLDDKEFGLLQLSIDCIMQKIAELGLNLVIERDFYKLNAFLTENDSFINPTYDPRVSKMGPLDYWLHLKDPRGNSVASMGERMFETDDFTRLVATGELWWHNGIKAQIGKERFSIVLPRHKITGRVSHSGSVWIAPAWRQMGLSLYIPYLSRSLCLRNYNIDFNTGFVRSNLVRTPVPQEAYGYPHVELCYDGYFPPAGGREQLYLCYISQSECVQKVRDLPANRRYPVDLDAGDGIAAADPLPVTETVQ